MQEVEAEDIKSHVFEGQNTAKDYVGPIQRVIGILTVLDIEFLAVINEGECICNSPDGIN